MATVTLGHMQNPQARQLLAAFDTTGKGVVDTTSVPKGLLDRIEALEKKATPTGRTMVKPLVSRIRAGEIDVSTVRGTDAWDKALAQRIDHTLLSPDATAKDIEKLCTEAIAFGFRAVCVMPKYARLASQLVAGTGVKVACVVGFPSGATSKSEKVREAMNAVKDGASEIDMVANSGLAAQGFKDGVSLKAYADEVSAISKGMLAAAAGRPVQLKVILQTGIVRKAAEKTQGETGMSADDAIRTVSQLAAAALVNAGMTGFIKTCTGVYEKTEGAATVEDVAIMHAVAQQYPGKIEVKASGGVRDNATAGALTTAGADIFGTSSGPTLVKGGVVKSGY